MKQIICLTPDRLQDSLCAFIDILGFKERTSEAARNDASSRNEETNQQRLLEEIVKALEQATTRLESGKNVTQVQSGKSRITEKFFTDNVIIGYSCKAESVQNDLLHLIEIVAEYQLCMATKGFFVRGGISHGLLAMNETIVFGKALLDAYELESKSAHYPRIILHPNLKQVIDVPLSSVPETDKATWARRLESDTDNFLFVNYLSALFGPSPHPRNPTNFQKIDESMLVEHRQQIETHLADSLSKFEIKAKYFWAGNYHNLFCDKYGKRDCKIDGDLLRPATSGTDSTGLVAVI